MSTPTIAATALTDPSMTDFMPRPLRDELDGYLTLRRSFGYALDTEARILRRLVEYAEHEGATHLSTGLFECWRADWGKASVATWSDRLGIFIQFARWLHARDPAHEVPSRTLISQRPVRPAPFIYTDEQIAAIIGEAERLRSDYGLRARTCSTLFGLIAVTGLRLSEALKLDVADFDTVRGVLTVRESKFGKSRLTPLTSDVTERLMDYGAERDCILERGTGSGAASGRAAEPMFVNERSGERLDDCTARYNFAKVGQRLGLREHKPGSGHGNGPRIHDLRHTFAVRTMIGWYERGLDPGREILKLSTYLGHSSPASSYWYIESVPELMELAAARAHRLAGTDGASPPTVPLASTIRHGRVRNAGYGLLGAEA